MERFSKRAYVMFKVFVVGVLLQFILQTFFTFKLGLEGGWKFIWLWKELVLILMLGTSVMYYLSQGKKLKDLLKNLYIKGYMLVTLIVILVVSIMHLLAGGSLYILLLSLKYTFSGFLIFIISYIYYFTFLTTYKEKIIKWFVKLMKYLLVGGLLWRFCLWLIPKLFTFVGYQQYIYEGKVGIAPPVTYMTQYDEGYIRNQFIFERPISWGFFLVAFWPLFFVLYIGKKGKIYASLWTGIYLLNIISTFSRASWLAWLVLTVLLLLVKYKKYIRTLILYVFIPGFIILFGLLYMVKDSLLQRDFSNNGHIKNIQIAVEYIHQQPVTGIGVGHAGPVTHQIETIKEYNPENQYLQIWLEYGILGFIGWMYLYLYLHFVGIKAWLQTIKQKMTKQQRYISMIVFAFSMGLLGLSIEGLVLHSFIDRMIVYPFMMLFGFIYAHYCVSIRRR